MSHQHWSNYWQTGAQTSLPQDFKGNYDGEIYQFWEQVVLDLRSGSRVLDVCTGNGAVALILADIAIKQNKKLQITAIDISEINVIHIKNNNPKEQTDMIKFISHCPIEKIDDLIYFEQDAIVSQFGLEYSNLNYSAPALRNILKAQGDLIFIAHSNKSAVFTYMDTENHIYNWLEKLNLFDVILKFVEGKLSATGLKNQIVSIVENNIPKTSFYSNDLFQSWQRMISLLIKQPNQQLKQQKQSLNHFILQHQFAKKRLQDMLEVSAKLSQKNWYQPLIKNGFKLIESNQLQYQKQHNVGIYYRFKLNKD